MPVHIIRTFSLAGSVTIMSGLIYITAQQNLRQSANDPQIQMAEDAATALNAGADTLSLISLHTVDIAQSLAPYLLMFDDAGKPIAGSGLLHGQIPTLPAGVLDAARAEEHRVTWQPETSVRSAIVIRHIDGMHPGYVVAGRSLRETENRESQLTWMVVMAWIVSLFLVALTAMPLLKPKSENLNNGN
jgi:hypothetical protein